MSVPSLSDSPWLSTAPVAVECRSRYDQPKSACVPGGLPCGQTDNQFSCWPSVWPGVAAPMPTRAIADTGSKAIMVPIRFARRRRMPLPARRWIMASGPAMQNQAQALAPWNTSSAHATRDRRRSITTKVLQRNSNSAAASRAARGSTRRPRHHRKPALVHSAGEYVQRCHSSGIG